MTAQANRQRAKGVKTVLKWLASLMLLTSLHAFAQSTNSVTYVYTDPQGTPLAEADASGNITATFEYTPYGTFAPTGTSNPGPDPNGPGYTGHVNDPETNLVYMQARYYDSATGHFLSVDPVVPQAGSESGFNRYAYGNNNPIANTDPTGQFPGDLGGDPGDAAYNAQISGGGTDSSAGNIAVTGAPLNTSSGASDKNQKTNVTTPTATSNNMAAALSHQVLTYVQWSDPERGSQGVVEWDVTWQLSQPSQSGGYVVQEMLLTGRSSNNPGGNGTAHYWEAWRIMAGATQTPSIAAGLSQWDDSFKVGPQTGSGSITWRGSARFYEGLILPSTFKPGQPFAGAALSTTIDPHLSTTHATAPVNRTLTTNWP
jgi:RHS repeat-associated protein